MKKLIVLLLFCSAAMLGQRTHTDKKAGFEIKIPRDWKKERMKDWQVVALKYDIENKSLESRMFVTVKESVLLTTPFIRPFKIGRIVFTYLIPMVPLCIMWDGVVSSLRTYSLKEMNELVAGLQNKDDYQWTIGKEKNVLYLIGLPAK